MDCPWLRRTVQVLLTAIYAAALMREVLSGIAICGCVFPTFNVPLAYHIMFALAVIGVSFKDLPTLLSALVYGRVKKDKVKK